MWNWVEGLTAVAGYAASFVCAFSPKMKVLLVPSVTPATPTVRSPPMIPLHPPCSAVLLKVVMYLWTNVPSHPA